MAAKKHSIELTAELADDGWQKEPPSEMQLIEFPRFWNVRNPGEFEEDGVPRVYTLKAKSVATYLAPGGICRPCAARRNAADPSDVAMVLSAGLVQQIQALPNIAGMIERQTVLEIVGRWIEKDNGECES